MIDMSKFIFSLSFIIASQLSFSQSHTKGSFVFALGYEASGVNTLYDSKFDDGTVNYEDPQKSSAAFINQFRFDGHYNLTNSFSIGINYRRGKYIEDPDNTQAAGNTVSLYAISARYYILNKDRLALYFGASFGGNQLVMNRLTKIIVSIPYTYKFGGTHFTLETGVNWYISKNVGVNIGLGYIYHKYKMKEYTFNLEEQDLSNFENILLVSGMTGNIGLTFKLGN